MSLENAAAYSDRVRPDKANLSRFFGGPAFLRHMLRFLPCDYAFSLMKI